MTRTTAPSSIHWLHNATTGNGRVRPSDKRFFVGSCRHRFSPTHAPKANSAAARASAMVL